MDQNLNLLSLIKAQISLAFLAKVDLLPENHSGLTTLEDDNTCLSQELHLTLDVK